MIKPITLKLGYERMTIDFVNVVIPWLLKVLFLVFVYFGFFSRYSGFFGLSGGMTATIISFFLFLLCCVHMYLKKGTLIVSHMGMMFALLFILLAIGPMVSYFIYDERINHVFRYSIEVGISFCMFFSTYYLVREGIITPRFFIYAMAFVGLLSAVQLLSQLFTLERFGRLRGMGGLNYLGISYTISLFAFLMIANSAKLTGTFKWLIYSGLFLSFLAMFFTGTRQAFLAFILAIVLYQVFGMQSKKFKWYLLSLTVIVVLMIGIIATQIDFTNLFMRYSAESIAYMADKRFRIYYTSIADLSGLEFVVGRPDLAVIEDGLIADRRYINTHNIFLSFIRYHGFFVFGLFIILFSYLLINYFKVYWMRKNISKYRLTEVSMLIFIVILIVHVSFSGGKVSRTFSFFVMMGYMLGYIEILKNIKSASQYKKMIL